MSEDTEQQQWEEIKVEDVQPGDVARCNGREFMVMETHEGSRRKWYFAIGAYHIADYDKTTINALGFTFWRRVIREPRTLKLRAQVQVHDDVEGGPFYSLEFVNMDISKFEHGTRFEGTLTEVLGEES